MKTTPLLFNGDMIRALLDGLKTQTRRIVKPQPQKYDNNIPGLTSGCHGYTWNGKKYLVMDYGHEEILDPIKKYCPYGQPGDLIWVRENCEEDVIGSQSVATYQANGDYLQGTTGCYIAWWYSRRVCPNIYMPRWASRLTLKITNIRVERVQDISEEDALCEGVPRDEEYPLDSYICPDCGGQGVHGAAGENLGWIEVDCDTCATAKQRFQLLWNSINSNWDQNPWVWVIEFEVINKNVDEVIEQIKGHAA